MQEVLTVSLSSEEHRNTRRAGDIPMAGTGALTDRSCIPSRSCNLPAERREYILNEHDLHQQTNYSVAEQQALREELQHIRDQGFALDDEERIDRMRGIAVPITRGYRGIAWRALDFHQ